MIARIVSGGQTGADRAALDFALRRGIQQGGWCPRGRRAEDGALPNSYCLRETPDATYAQRTEWNIRDTDGTAIFSLSPDLMGGSLLTANLAKSLGKPCLHVCKQRDGTQVEELLATFLRRNKIRVLNVAGPRESTAPGIYDYVIEILEQWWSLRNG